MNKTTRPNRKNTKANPETKATAKTQTKATAKTPAEKKTKKPAPAKTEKKETVKNSVEVRKAFYDGFKAGFNTADCFCKADTEMAEVKDTSWKDDFHYVHIFKEGKKAQLFYYQFTGKKLYFVVSDNEAVKRIGKSGSKAITVIEPIVQVTKLKRPLEAETEYRHFLTDEQQAKFTDGIPRASIQKGACIFCNPDVESAVELAKVIRDILTSAA